MSDKFRADSVFFVRAWNVLEGNTDLLGKLFDLSKRQIIKKASELRTRGLILPKFNKPGVKKKQYSE